MKKIIKKIYKNTFEKLFPSTRDIFDGLLISELKHCHSLLDIGCGPSSPFGRIKNELNLDLYSIGVDNFDPYIEISKRNRIHSEYIKSDILSINYPDKNFDCAILIDVIEHFNKEDFLNFLPKLEKMVKKIIIMTPNGFVKQDEYDGNFLQVHKSGWTVKEMEHLGFKCFGISGIKFLRREKALTIIRPIVLGNIISDITEQFVYNRPELAYHLMCIKNI